MLIRVIVIFLASSRRCVAAVAIVSSRLCYCSISSVAVGVEDVTYDVVEDISECHRSAVAGQPIDVSCVLMAMSFLWDDCSCRLNSMLV